MHGPACFLCNIAGNYVLGSAPAPPSPPPPTPPPSPSPPPSMISCASNVTSGIGEPIICLHKSELTLLEMPSVGSHVKCPGSGTHAAGPPMIRRSASAPTPRSEPRGTFWQSISLFSPLLFAGVYDYRCWLPSLPVSGLKGVPVAHVDRGHLLGVLL